MRVTGRQEHVVEREALWGITKLRVDGGRVINICAVAVAAVRWKVLKPIS
jgi:TPP-dependent pyruvate/acetoin dehydrogenase alpha subunit